MTKSMKQEEVFTSFKGVSCISGAMVGLGIEENCFSESCGSAALYCLWNLLNRLDIHPLTITKSILDPTLSSGLDYMDCKAPFPYF